MLVILSLSLPKAKKSPHFAFGVAFALAYLFVIPEGDLLLPSPSSRRLPA